MLEEFISRILVNESIANQGCRRNCFEVCSGVFMLGRERRQSTIISHPWVNVKNSRRRLKKRDEHPKSVLQTWVFFSAADLSPSQGFFSFSLNQVPQPQTLSLSWSLSPIFISVFCLRAHLKHSCISGDGRPLHPHQLPPPAGSSLLSSVSQFTVGTESREKFGFKSNILTKILPTLC